MKRMPYVLSHPAGFVEHIQVTANFLQRSVHVPTLRNAEMRRRVFSDCLDLILSVLIELLQCASSAARVNRTLLIFSPSCVV